METCLFLLPSQQQLNILKSQNMSLRLTSGISRWFLSSCFLPLEGSLGIDHLTVKKRSHSQQLFKFYFSFFFSNVLNKMANIPDIKFVIHLIKTLNCMCTQ